VSKSRKSDRIKACELAARVLQGRGTEVLVPRLWSVVTFFEAYIADGANGTLEEFGPKEPVRIGLAKVVGDDAR
jgi:hypothetical protein